MQKKSGAMRHENGYKKCWHCRDLVKINALPGHVKACGRRVAAATVLKAKRDARKNVVPDPIFMKVGTQRFPVFGNPSRML